MNKCLSASDVVSRISSGMTIGIGGWGPRRKPMALVRELLRSDVKDLTVVAYGGADVGMLCAAGKVKKVVFAFVSLDFIPLEPYFRKARQNGEIEVMEIDEGMFLLGLKAAAMRVPFIPTRLGLGTDVLTHNPQLKVIESPYGDGRQWLAMPALGFSGFWGDTSHHTWCSPRRVSAWRLIHRCPSWAGLNDPPSSPTVGAGRGQPVLATSMGLRDVETGCRTAGCGHGRVWPLPRTRYL